MKMLQYANLLFFACIFVSSVEKIESQRDKTILFVGQTASTTSLPLVVSCDEATYSYIQLGGITMDGNPLSESDQKAAEDECTGQLAKPSGKLAGKGKTRCEIWFGPHFQFNDTSKMLAVFQCFASNPGNNVTWARPKQPKDETKTSSKETNKILVLKCNRGNSLITINSVLINNAEVNVTAFPELGKEALTTKCFKETITDVKEGFKGAVKCTVMNKSAYMGTLSIDYSCTVPPVITEEEQKFIPVEMNQTIVVTPSPQNISKENTCLNTRPCVSGGVCVLDAKRGYICDCLIDRMGFTCEIKLRTFENRLNVSELMFMGTVYKPSDAATVISLANNQSSTYKRIVKALENMSTNHRIMVKRFATLSTQTCIEAANGSLKQVYYTGDQRTQNVEVTQISIETEIMVVFKVYMKPDGEFREGKLAETFKYNAAGYLVGFGLNSKISNISVMDLDDCRTTPCQNDGVCVKDNETWTCNCKSGYSGQNCEQGVDACAENNCHNNALCVPLKNGYECRCYNGLQGKFCKDPVPVDTEKSNLLNEVW